MKSEELQQRFIILRAGGKSFARIAEELNVSKPTLIDWSRKFQFEINNLKAVEAEALRERHLASREERLHFMAQNLKRIESEIVQRDLSEIPTARLFALASSLRGEISREIGEVQFSANVKSIPSGEYVESALDWRV